MVVDDPNPFFEHQRARLMCMLGYLFATRGRLTGRLCLWDRNGKGCARSSNESACEQDDANRNVQRKRIDSILC